MAKVLYSGDADWIIGSYAYVCYSKHDIFFTREDKWPPRLAKGRWAHEATPIEVHNLIIAIWSAKSITVGR